MRKTLVSLLTGIAGAAVLLAGLYQARIGIGLTGLDIFIAITLVFLGIFLIGAGIHRLSEEET